MDRTIKMYLNRTVFLNAPTRKWVQRKWSHWAKNESDLVIIVFSIWFAIDPLLCLLEICQLCIFSVDFIGAKICRCSAFWRHIKSNGSAKETIINGMNIQNDCHKSRFAIARYIIIDSFLLFAIFLNHSSDSVHCNVITFRIFPSEKDTHSVIPSCDSDC